MTRATIAGPGSAGEAREWSAGATIRLGLAAIFILVGGLGGWATFATISGAVVAEGRLKVEGNRQVVQHLEGGVVAELNARDGDLVEAGQVLIRLDDTRLRAELGIVESQLFESLARVGRLEAQQIDAETMTFDAELLDLSRNSPAISAMIEGQQVLFTAQAETVQRETAQLRERQSQIGEEIVGSEAQRASLSTQLDFIERELIDQRSLLARGLTQQSRVLALEREKAKLEGEAGQLTARIAEARGRSTEIDVQITGLEARRREDAISELRDLRASEAELRERRIALLDQLGRLDIRAPRGGVILGQTVFTVGAVVRPAEPLMYVVPSESALIAEVRIPPQNIDQVYPGQPARLRFSAFNNRTTPEFESEVMLVSADSFTDEATGMSFYTSNLSITQEAITALRDLDGLTLVAGMPVEAYIQTGDRSPLSYLVQPMTDFFSRSLREE